MRESNGQIQGDRLQTKVPPLHLETFPSREMEYSGSGHLRFYPGVITVLASCSRNNNESCCSLDTEPVLYSTMGFLWAASSVASLGRHFVQHGKDETVKRNRNEDGPTW